MVTFASATAESVRASAWLRPNDLERFLEQEERVRSASVTLEQPDRMRLRFRPELGLPLLERARGVVLESGQRVEHLHDGDGPPLAQGQRHGARQPVVRVDQVVVHAPGDRVRHVFAVLLGERRSRHLNARQVHPLVCRKGPADDDLAQHSWRLHPLHFHGEQAIVEQNRGAGAGIIRESGVRGRDLVAAGVVLGSEHDLGTFLQLARRSQVARPRRAVETGQVLLELDAVHHPSAVVPDWRLVLQGWGAIVHEEMLHPLPTAVLD